MTDKPTDLRIFDPTRVRALFEAKEAALASAQERIEALERDARRYRWLRERHEITFPVPAFPTIPWVVRVDRLDAMPAMVGVHGVTLDAAIDAALSPSEPGA